MRIARLVPVILTTGLLAVMAFAADNKSATDQFWLAPDYDAYPVRSIALLPPATFDGNFENRRLVETAVGQALRGSGHRWVSSFMIRDIMMKNGGDSLTQALNEKLLRTPRLDSLDAPRLARLLRTRAILTVRVDQMERRELEPGQSGRPTTAVHLRAALVDSTGRLLWTASSTETLEGAQQDAEANVIGVKASGLNNQGIGNTTSAPTFQEVLTKVCSRWKEPFPKRALPDSTAAPR